MQTIKNINDQLVITVKDDQYPDRIAIKRISMTSQVLYENIYETLRKELNKNLIFYVSPTTARNEWGLGKRGLHVTTGKGQGSEVLWITPYYVECYHNCICIAYRHFEKLKKSQHYKKDIPANHGKRTGLCQFANYNVYKMTYPGTGSWFFIYIDNMDNFDKVVELIKDIGIWN